MGARLEEQRLNKGRRPERREIERGKQEIVRKDVMMSLESKGM